ncbi:MAG: hypothetical protein JXA15_07735 [Spirochaetales bacterium]|nr:hypothetical protein [Spirochaetales bacterium]
MKRIFMALLVVAVFLAALPAVAQDRPGVPVEPKIIDPSPYYPFRFDVIRVYSHALGYRVLYRKGSSDFADVYIPAGWFKSGGKASLVVADDPAFPSMTIFYKDGAFSHVRLYVRASRKDSTWGLLTEEDPSAKFEVTELKVAF